MKNQPLISVIIPTYNAETTIVKTLESVINQTYKNIEIIIVNDGSKDNSEHVISDYCIKQSITNIRLINKENGGVSSARNRGIDESKGEFIAFLDSDDLWLQDKIEKQLDVFEDNPQIDCLGTNMNGVVFHKLFGFSFERITRITPKMMLLKNFLCIQTTMIKKKVLKDIGYFYEDQVNEDSNIIIRIADKYNCYLLNEPYVIYIPNASGLSSRMWEMEKGELKNILMALKMKQIKPIEFPFYVGFSLIKFSRRVLISYLNKDGKKRFF